MERSWFGGSAWKLDPQTDQYYYHYFYTEQPDLNWRNPEVKKAMYDVPQQQLWLFLKAIRVATLRNLNDCKLEKMILSWRHAFC